MKNFEKYIDSLSIANCMRATKDNKNSVDTSCDGCEFATDEWCDIKKIKQWLLEEYQEPIRLTHDEYVILKNLGSEYKFLWRDLNEELYISENAPIIDENNNYLGLGCFADLPYNYDFLFVNCDDEPYEIAKLIADYEREHEQ